jgi:hypothetical protein
VSAALESAWDELVNKDDRTSPPEYPDMCLITREELAQFMILSGEPLIEVITDLRDKMDTANALLHCECGSRVDGHGMGDGHSPVSMYHYAYYKLEEENDRLRHTVEFVQRWAWREDPPNASRKLSDEERLSTIKFYPGIKVKANG